MLWLIAVLFFFAALLLNPVYVMLRYENGGFRVDWLPRVFGGTARPVRLPWPRLEQDADREAKRKDPGHPKAYLVHLIRAHIGALVLEQLELRGGWAKSPAATAWAYWALAAGALAWRECFFLHRGEIRFQPFFHWPQKLELRLVVSVTVGYLIWRSVKRRVLR